MVGRKAVKGHSNKAQATTAALGKKTTKRLKKLRKIEPANRVDLSKCTNFVTLHLDKHTRDINKQLKDVFATDFGNGVNVEAVSEIRHPNSNASFIELLLQLRNGLDKKRLEALSNLADIIAVNPGCILTIGLKLITDLCARVIDSQRGVRRHAIELIHEGILLRLRESSDRTTYLKFCTSIRSTLWLQLRLTLAHIDGHTRLDGLVFFFKLVTVLPPVLFRERTFINQIFPMAIKQLSKAINGTPKQSKSKSAGAMTPFDGVFYPLFSRWTPVMLTSVLLCFSYILEPNLLENDSNATHDEPEPQLPFKSLIELARHEDGSSLSSSDLGNSDENEPLIFNLMTSLTNLMRTTFYRIEDLKEGVSDALAIVPGVLYLAISLAHWCQEIIRLHEQISRQRLDVVPSPIKTGETSKLLCQRLLKINQSSRAVNMTDWIQHDQNSYLRCLSDTMALLDNNRVSGTRTEPLTTPLSALKDSFTAVMYSMTLSDNLTASSVGSQVFNSFIRRVPSRFRLESMLLAPKQQSETEGHSILGPPPSPFRTTSQAFLVAFDHGLRKAIGIRTSDAVLHGNDGLEWLAGAISGIPGRVYDEIEEVKKDKDDASTDAETEGIYESLMSENMFDALVD